ncbi:LysR family transcriptional regulator [Blastomonas sp. UPD001]|jgi:LysR family transcriptional regulator, regulator for genes of the gallate degradation pathway|uniref:LysR family transcriptional regulator n=1 Tax=Blastomonas sp. UPD001 TaxID=2217673 RepID=UPI000E348ED3|nr:LysR family transcriptional regulator [Blastomonas sp. UPD001]MBL0965975.1 LysR family transcriptional regulator [Blastomonas sp.]
MMESLNLRHLRSVVAITRLGSISAAATHVNISQPAITQGLSKLEAQLGIALFHRLPEGMQPTEAAAVLTPRIERALDHVGSPLVTMAQMRALLTLAEGGSYARASAITGLSQPALHRALADLAIVLRRPLVERRGKGIAFTHGGRRTVRAFRLARAELRAGLAEIETLKGREVDRIAVGAMPLSRARVLPEAVAAFHLAHPEARILISEGAFIDLIEPLRDGDLDVIVGALRDPAPGEDVEQQPLFLDRPAIIGRKDHPLASGVASLAQLAEYPWIASPAGTPLHSRWRAMFERAGLALPRVPIECGSVIAIRQILATSDFLAMLSPDQVGLELSTGLLGIIAEVPAELSRTIGITMRSGWRPTMVQAAFLEQLRLASGAIDASRTA